MRSGPGCGGMRFGFRKDVPELKVPGLAVFEPFVINLFVAARSLMCYNKEVCLPCDMEKR